MADETVRIGAGHGDVAATAVAHMLARLGLRPVVGNECEPWDLMVKCGAHTLFIQVKTMRSRSPDTFQATLTDSSGLQYAVDDFDFFALYCSAYDTIFIMPRSAFAGRTTVSWRPQYAGSTWDRFVARTPGVLEPYREAWHRLFEALGQDCPSDAFERLVREVCPRLSLPEKDYEMEWAEVLAFLRTWGGHPPHTDYGLPALIVPGRARRTPEVVDTDPLPSCIVTPTGVWEQHCFFPDVSPEKATPAEWEALKRFKARNRKRAKAARRRRRR